MVVESKVRVVTNQPRHALSAMLHGGVSLPSNGNCSNLMENLAQKYFGRLERSASCCTALLDFKKTYYIVPVSAFFRVKVASVNIVCQRSCDIALFSIALDKMNMLLLGTSRRLAYGHPYNPTNHHELISKLIFKL